MAGYKSIARALGDKSIITRTLAERLVKMSGYRNRLVHLYHKIEDEGLYGIIQNNLYGIIQNNIDDIYDYSQGQDNFP